MSIVGGSISLESACAMPSCRRHVGVCSLLVVKFGSQEDVVAGQGRELPLSVFNLRSGVK